MRIKFSFDLLWNHQDQLANLHQILYVSSVGWGIAAFRSGGRFHPNCDRHGNRKLPLIYNGENDVSTLMPSVLIRSVVKLAGNEDRHKIPDEFEIRPDRTTPFGVRGP